YPLAECPSLLGSLLCRSGLLEHRFVVVQLHLATGWWTHRLGHAAGTSSEAAIPQRTSSARLDREAEEAHRSVLLVTCHPKVRRRDALRTGHTPLPVVGGEIDGELVLAE